MIILNNVMVKPNVNVSSVCKTLLVSDLVKPNLSQVKCTTQKVIEKINLQVF